jgi:predicted ATPase/class 3 adenylate cyclase
MTTTDSMTFSALLRRLRLGAGLTQEALAERARLSARAVSDLERDPERMPRLETVRLLADALELSSQERATLIAAAHPIDQQRETAELPVDNVSPSVSIRTFLIADLGGYTGFTEAQGDEAAARLTTRFAALVRACVDEHAGEVVETRGDEVLVAFSSARQALRAAVQLQEACAQVMRTEPALQVGIGLDAGEAIPIGDGYRGGALNLAARLCSLAGSREIFASEGVVHLARKVEGLVFVDRGAVQLKGLSEPVRVIQIAPEGQLPQELPPLQPSLVTHPTNLPDEPTPFIGREREIAAIGELLRRPTVRLVTLTGAGGSGKTRLALQVGARLLDEFGAGVFFVSLASIGDPALVPSAMATTLGVKEAGAQPLLELLAAHLHEKQLLLVLDNFEHLLDAAGVVGTLLERCPRLKMLVTSRAVLHLFREHAFEVLPLAVPDPKQLPDLAQLSQYEAVALFIERAQAAKADFSISNENAPTVAEICYRLDGLPLAIELAAARIRMFPPQALLRRLGRRLRLLTGGARDREARQQTLRRTIDWSYDLLEESQRTVFGRLSVFAGGCTLEAAEAVCDGDRDLGIEILDGIASLIEQSLLREEGEDEPRFLMLETIREYGLEQLQESGEEERVRSRHAAYYLALAESAEPELIGPDQVIWLSRLERDHDNLRASLSWTLHRGDAVRALRLAGALWRYWSVRGYVHEGHRWLQEVLGLASSDVDPVSSVQVKALVGAAMLAMDQATYDQAGPLCARAVAMGREGGKPEDLILALNAQGLLLRQRGRHQDAAACYEEALALAQGIGDRAGEATAFSGLALMRHRFRGDPAREIALFERSLAIYHELGDLRSIAATLNNFAWSAMTAGDYDRAQNLREEALALFQALGDAGQVAETLWGLGNGAQRQGDFQRAEAFLEESLALRRERGDERSAAVTQARLGHIALNLGDVERARTLATEALAAIRHHDDPWGLAMVLTVSGHVELVMGDAERAQLDFGESARLFQALGILLTLSWCLEGLAGVALTRGEYKLAARLVGARDALLARLESPVPPAYPDGYARMLDTVRGGLGEEAFAEEYAMGAELPLEQALTEAAGASKGAKCSGSAPTEASGLHL